MARGGGRSGGGRSFGGGGGRSGGFGRSGSSRGSSGFGRGGSGFGHRGPTFGGGFHPRPRPGYRPRTSGFFPGFIMGRMSGGYAPHGHHHGGGHGHGGGFGVGIIAAIALVIVLIVVVFNMNGFGGGSVTASTIEREPLPAGLVNETEYYTDEIRKIENATVLTSGMRSFYRSTGVQPHLYTINSIDGNYNPSDAQFEQFADATYDRLFTDEAHILLIFQEHNYRYNLWYWNGEQADTILDREAVDIVMDYIVRYYPDESMSVDRAFSKAFEDAGERIMSVTTSPWIPALIVLGVLVILIVGFFWWRAHKKQKNLEAEQTQKIFETPLETFGDTEAEERAKKYEDEE